MPKLPVVTGDKVVKAFSKAGWIAVRQRGTLRDLIRDIKLTVEEFYELL